VLVGYSEAADASGCALVSYLGYTIEQPIDGPGRLLAALRQLVAGTSAGTIGVEEHALPLFLRDALPSRAAVVPIDGALAPLRSVGVFTSAIFAIEAAKNASGEIFDWDSGTDAAVTGKPAAYQYVRTRGGLRVLEQQLTTEEYGMALRKDTPELTKAVNGAITKLKADGTYAAIVKKWFSNSAAK